uniref:Ig-like domain-containing protein n=1 Tax=Salmo trutta TaxID=8032 RepID=A0A674E2J0_SALTR
MREQKVLCLQLFLSLCLLSFRSDPCFQPGKNVTFQCTDATGAPGHVGWFKQDNGSEPRCIASMYSSEPTVQHHNGFQPSRMEMLISNRTIFLKIAEVDEADSGHYFCGMFDKYIIFTNATVLRVKGKSPFHDNMGPIQDPDTLNYAALNFTSEKRKMERRREKELDTHVVYAATR